MGVVLNPVTSSSRSIIIVAELIIIAKYLFV